VNTSDGLVVGGYHSLLITQAAEGLPIRLNERVTSVSVSADVNDSPGSSYDCLPIGAG